MKTSTHRKKQQHKTAFEHAGYVAIRAPARNASAWHAYVAQGKNEAGTSCLIQRALAAKELFADPAVQEAIWLASAGLYQRLANWDWTIQGDDGRKLLSTFDRYYNRMCFRATPYGTFSTVSLAALRGNCGDPAFSSEMLFDVPLRRAFAVDAEISFHLMHRALTLAPQAFGYVVNASLYKRGDFLRYIDWRQGKYGTRSYRTSEIRWNNELAEILNKRGRGPFTYAALRDTIAGAAECSAEDAEAIIAELVSSKLLLPHPGMSFFAADGTRLLHDALPRVPALADLVTGFAAAFESIEKLPQTEPVPVSSYRALNERLARIVESEFGTGSCLQADSFKKLPVDHIDDVAFASFSARVGELFLRFGRRNTALDKFREKFSQRYDREFVQLLDVLDDETLSTESYDFAIAADYNVSALDRILLKKMIAAGSAQHPIMLNLDDIEDLPIGACAAATTDVFAIAEKIATATNNQTGQFELIDIFASHSMRWLARFAHQDPALASIMRAAAVEIEQRDPNIAHLEVAYIPTAKFGHVMRRPLVWSNVLDLVELTEGADAIPVADLWLAQGNDGLELWSKSLNKPVMPHVTSAHNARHPGNTKLYMFLRAFENQNKWQFHLLPGTSFSEMPSFPRIEYEGIVVSPAKWRLRSKELLGEPDLRRALHERGVPQWVKMTETGDNSLVIDTHAPSDLEQLARTAASSEIIYLREYFAPPPSSSPAVPHVNHELIVPMRAKGAAPAAPARRTDFSAAHAYQQQPRFARHISLSKIVYVKLYMSPGMFDIVIDKLYRDLVREPQFNANLQSWFFIRYADPGHHIRLRMACKENSAGIVMQSLSTWLDQLQQTRIVDSYNFDQYRPEYSRYKGPALTDLSEQLFWRCSVLSCEILQVRRQHGPGLPALHGMIFAVDRLLGDAGLDFKQAHRVVYALEQAFAAEFDINKQKRAALSAEFRLQAEKIEQILMTDTAAPPWLDGMEQAWNLHRAERAELLRTCRDSLTGLEHSWEDGEFLKSHVHMACNRLINNSRPWELRTYSYLSKAYRSLIARGLSRTTRSQR